MEQRFSACRVAATEQYPQGLGPTTPELAERLGTIPAKIAFSCGECGEIFTGWRDRGIWKILVCGIETHVCVGQTVHDLLGEGFRVYVAADAVGARGPIDHEIALRRMDSAGATLTTIEAALFEWCGRAGSPEFKQISQLVQRSGPAEQAWSVMLVTDLACRSSAFALIFADCTM